MIEPDEEITIWEDAITVRALIKALQALGDPSLPVLVEGCDCLGECGGVAVRRTP